MSVLPPTDEALVAASLAARDAAWAPYSGYRVGAAVRGESGRIYGGCNVEIASFSHTCCAERVAVFKAISEGERALTGAAIATQDDPPATPCGACRQVMAEFGGDMPVWLVNLDGAVVATRLSTLLPGAFTRERLLPHLRRVHGKTPE